VIQRRYSVLSIMLALNVLGLQAPPAPERPTAHDRAFWKGIVEHDYAVPEGLSAATLIGELSTYLGSPDKELRDEFAYSIPVRWIYIDKRLSPEELRRFLRMWSANLESGLGEKGTDTVLLRSFSALDLSVLAALDLERPFMTDAEFHGLLSEALLYLGKEADVRGYEERVGWIHSAAHTADLLKFLSRNRALKAEDQKGIVLGIEARLQGAGSFFTHGEDERLARALLSLVRRPDFDPAPLETWCERVKAAEAKLSDARVFDHDRFIAVQNQKSALKSLAVLLFAEKAPTPQAKEVEKGLVALLAG
jgi:hypothetical protein